MAKKYQYLIVHEEMVLGKASSLAEARKDKKLFSNRRKGKISIIKNPI